MQRLLVLVLVVFGLTLVPGHMFSAGSPQGAPGTPGGMVFLDLPDGFGWTEEEEDEPELIEFYNDEYEGDAFFFCLDRSSSMGQLTASGQVKFDVLKRETVKAISGLSKRSVVSVVFYNFQMQPLVIGDPPIKMDAAGKGRMIGQVSGTPISNGSCMLRGALKCLELVQKTQHEHRTMILTSDGRTHCPNDETDPNRIFSQITARNTLKIPINTIYTGPQSGADWTEGKPLLERLSLASNGRFKVAQ